MPQTKAHMEWHSVHPKMISAFSQPPCSSAPAFCFSWTGATQEVQNKAGKIIREINHICQLNLLIYLTMYLIFKSKNAFSNAAFQQLAFLLICPPIEKADIKIINHLSLELYWTLNQFIFSSCLTSQQEWFYRLASKFLHWLLNQLIRVCIFSHVCKEIINESYFTNEIP